MKSQAKNKGERTKKSQKILKEKLKDKNGNKQNKNRRKGAKISEKKGKK